jgi:prevent-host-death family protein
MKTVGVFEAKTRFSALIADAVAGESTIVTKNGKPVAEIGPVKSQDVTRAKLAADRIRALRLRLVRGGKLKGANIRELMYEGRK